MLKAKETASEVDEQIRLAEEFLARDQSSNIENSEPGTGTVSYPAPVSVRLSAPLLQALDCLAAAQHRKRGNLIQHILWEYVNGHSPDGHLTAAASKQATSFQKTQTKGLVKARLDDGTLPLIAPKARRKEI